jgi:hypothetical protein
MVLVGRARQLVGRRELSAVTLTRVGTYVTSDDVADMVDTRFSKDVHLWIEYY